MEEHESGLSYRTIQAVEEGATNVTLRNLFLISKRLNIEVKDLFNFEIKSKTEKSIKPTKKENNSNLK